jgi:anti-sigma B factor antagonist
VGRPQDSEDFEVRIDDGEGVKIVRLSGELDMATAPALQEALHSAQHSSAPHIIVDLRGLTFLDSTGLGVMVAADLAGRDGHRKVSFVRGIPNVHRVFQITRVDERLDWTGAGD